MIVKLKYKFNDVQYINIILENTIWMKESSLISMPC